jgi:hypothetical protein
VIEAALAVLLAAPITLSPSPREDTRVDAFFQEWEGRPLFTLDRVVSGKVDDSSDLSGAVQVAYDAEWVFVAVQVKDDLFQPGTVASGDRLELVFAPLEGKATRVQVTLGQLELGTPPALRLNGKPYKKGQVVGTTRRDGWAVEVALRVRDLPSRAGGGWRFAALVDDCDHDSVSVQATLSTGPVSPERVPLFSTIQFNASLGLLDGYLTERGHPEIYERMQANVAGDSLPEEVVVSAHDIVVLGHLPGGSGYLFFTHGWREDVVVTRAVLQQLDGRPGSELWVEHTEMAVPGEVKVKVVEIYGVRDGQLHRMFAAKLGEEFLTLDGSAQTKLTVLPGKGARRLQIKPAKVSNLNPGNYVDVDAEAGLPYAPLPLPWQGKAARTYRLRGMAWRR